MTTTMQQRFHWLGAGTLTLLVAGAALAFPTLSASLGPGADDDETEIQLDDAPEAVQTVVKGLGATSISEIVRETEDGVTLFEIDYIASGSRKSSIKVTASGDVVERESDVQPDALPRELAAKLATLMPGVKIASAEHVEEHYFELKIEVDGKKSEIKINAAGGIEVDHGGMDERHEGVEDDDDGNDDEDEDEDEDDDDDDDDDR